MRTKIKNKSGKKRKTERILRRKKEEMKDSKNE